MRFQVTNRHIAKGKRGIRSCPIALAVKDILEPLGYRYISVGRNSISALYTNCAGYTDCLRIDTLPKEVSEFIVAFDEYVECLAKNSNNLNNLRRIIKSFEFELTIL